MRKYLTLGMLLSYIPLTHLFCLASVRTPFALDDYILQIYQRQNFSEEVDWESIKEALQEAYAAPLDLNKATPAALESLGILSQKQIDNYFKHRTATGPLYSKYELQAIPDFDLLTIELLLPFVYIPESCHTELDSLPMVKDKNNRCIFRYEPSLRTTLQPISIKQANLGNLDQYMIHLLLKPRYNITLSLTARKQAGEAFCLDHATHRYGFNLWSLFLAIEPKKYFQQIVIGDYQIGYGQGLLVQAGYTIGKGADNVSMIRPHIGIRPYKGIQRRGLRGVAVTSILGPITLTGFYANHNLDAAIKLDAANKPYSHCIDIRGKYDTLATLQKKGTIQEQIIGCTLLTQLYRKQTEIGMHLLYHHYDIPLIPKKSSFSQYLFQGKAALASSLFYRVLWGNLLLFGEGGITMSHPICTKKTYNQAIVAGAVLSLTRYVDLATALYHYGKGFFRPYGYAFKHYTTDQSNEKGLYGNITFTPFANWQLTTSGHFFATLRPKPQLAAASSGYGFTTRSSYRWNRVTAWILQHKFDKVPKQLPHSGDKFYKNTFASKHNIKLKLDHKLTYTWWTYIETQYIHYTFLDRMNHGFALANTQKWKGKKLQCTTKVIYFHTNHYATRCYLYEPDIGYSGTQFKPYYGKGLAIILVMHWHFTSFMRWEAKYGCTHLFKRLETVKKIGTPTQQTATLQVILYM